ncbi:calcium/sodium antiporter [Acetatifactor muris]|jgi:cation:H+ antiporter|uniref:Inner membrane protein YrbG n=1 Tax=Acetatifactor muris TaxID=879566 RepID=A0A2K4ZGH3_9FIRM|nr:calcium/sodium antiporter [Acetatifactor muris]MCR2045799.1 calcium/sodium antiporter [Acetatifactor muris]SOY29536.1 Inner membrane protein YrbG [Acetatifactor muris]
MELALTVFLFLVGIVFIVKGGDYFVDAASWIAEVSGIPKLIIGATIVSLATTLPEMLVSVMAAAKGSVDMAIGNAVGSVTANIGLIMAISLICMPAVIKRRDYLLKSILMLAAAGLIVACGFSGQTTMPISIVLILIFCVFLWENVTSAKKAMTGQGSEGTRRKPQGKEIPVNVTKFIVGAVGIVWGADLLVDNGSTLATLAGVPERVIGVTIIAVGTSLPELITTITAIIKKQSSLSVGNILGANIIDLTLILPLSSFVSGKALPIAEASARYDLPACLVVGCIALIPTMITRKFQKWQGILLLLAYGIYLYLTLVVAG